MGLSIPVESDRLEAAEALVGDFAQRLEDLVSGHAFRCNELPAPPTKPGVYLLAEGDSVRHVGRTRNLQTRRLNQTSRKGGKEAATFAFQLARHRARESHPHLTSLKREDLESHEDFVPIFAQAKEDVRDMDFRCVVIEDHPTQALFEIFASVALGSPYNSWETH